MRNYNEQIENIKDALELLDYSDEYDEHKYLMLQDRLIILIKELLSDEELQVAQKDALYKMAAITLGWYMEDEDESERYMNKMQELQKEGLLSKEQLTFFIENMNVDR